MDSSWCRCTTVSFSGGKIIRKEALREERRRCPDLASRRGLRGFPCRGVPREFGSPLGNQASEQSSRTWVATIFDLAKELQAIVGTRYPSLTEVRKIEG